MKTTGSSYEAPISILAPAHPYRDVTMFLATAIKTNEAALLGQELSMGKAEVFCTHSNHILNAFQHAPAGRQVLKPCIV